MISCCLSGYDADGPAVCKVQTRTARKRHECEECREPIEPGERYEYVRGLWEGYWSTIRTCEVCVSVRNDHDCGEGWEAGTMWEQLADCYGPEVISGDWSEDEDCDPMGPPPEWARAN